MVDNLGPLEKLSKEELEALIKKAENDPRFLKKDPYFTYECLICNQTFEGIMSYNEEDCTHYYMLECDAGNYCLPVCESCGDVLFPILPNGKMIYVLNITKPVFLDAEKLTLKDT